MTRRPTSARPSRPSRRRMLTGAAIGGAALGIRTIPLSPVLAGSPDGATLPPPAAVDVRLAVAFRDVVVRRSRLLLRLVGWTARLVRAGDGSPVVGVTVTLAVTGETITSGASDVTDSTGQVAQVAVAADAVPIGAAFTIAFAGDGVYKPASVTGTVS